MTQLFIGHKSGAGPAVKTLLSDEDDPLTVANDAYDRYLFNSENQKLSYVFGHQSLDLVLGMHPSTGVYHYNGNASTAWTSAYYEAAGSTFAWWGCDRLDNIYPGLPFVPLAEIREHDFDPRMSYPGTASLAYRGISWVVSQTNNEWATRTSLQFTSVAAKNASGMLHSSLSMIPIGSWIASVRNTIRLTLAAPHVLRRNTAYWKLPADSSPMPTFTPVVGKEMVRLSPIKVAVARPGHDVTDTGIDDLIIDSDRDSPALCVMAGETASIPASGSLTLYPPPGIALSPSAVMDAMVRKDGEEQYIPTHILAGLTRDVWVEVRYEIVDNSLVIYNLCTFPVIVTYFVFNVDATGISEGGSQVIYQGNDGEQDYIQIKPPGTSDPASRPNDILLDTRFPTLHILSEGWLPIGDFVDAPGGEQQLLGRKCFDVTFDDAGLIPFVKYTIVWADAIVPPRMTIWYSFTGFYQWGPPNNQSALCRLRPGVARFYLNPGNWSRMVQSGNIGVATYDLPDPLGLRYYIFGIPTS